MKFKEFKVYVNKINCELLFMAVVEHAIKLGYNWYSGNKKFPYSMFNSGFIIFDSNGDMLQNTDDNHPNPISLDDFFKLTKEDVIVEPERTLWVLRKHNSGDIDYLRSELTQGQVDRIKEIMNEVAE